MAAEKSIGDEVGDRILDGSIPFEQGRRRRRRATDRSERVVALNGTFRGPGRHGDIAKQAHDGLPEGSEFFEAEHAAPRRGRRPPVGGRVQDPPYELGELRRDI